MARIDGTAKLTVRKKVERKVTVQSPERKSEAERRRKGPLRSRNRLGAAGARPSFEKEGELTASSAVKKGCDNKTAADDRTSVKCEN